MSTSGHWFGPPERPLLGWLTAPHSEPSATGVLILPPVGYAYWSSHRTLRVLAERLAADGHLTLRIDYDGTGDSAGEQSDGGRLEAWRASAAAAGAELRELGCERLVIVGVRLGATIALLDGAELAADAVVAWAPVVAGRRYVKELRLLGAEVPPGVSTLPPGALVASGCVYLPQTLADLGALSVGDVKAAPASHVLLLAAEETALVERLAELGCAVQQRGLDGSESALERPSEYATVPQEVVSGIAGWIATAASADPSTRAAPAPGTNFERTTAHLIQAGVELREAVITLGAQRFVGVQTEPAAGAGEDATTLVLLNTGSEPHIGPGRAWVEYSRQLAADGYRCVRVDFRGWGESPDDGHAPGRPYDAHCIDDAREIVRALRAQADGPIVLLGLCASSWVALRLALSEPLDGVIALNPQLYWQPGDPVEATMAETRLRRTATREREARGGRSGLWSALDALGLRSWAGHWLDALQASGVPVALVFAEGDDGIEFLRNRLARRLAHAQRNGSIRIVEIPEIDHAMGRVWLRERVVEVVREQLADAEAGLAPPAALTTSG